MFRIVKEIGTVGEYDEYLVDAEAIVSIEEVSAWQSQGEYLVTGWFYSEWGWDDSSESTALVADILGNRDFCDEGCEGCQFCDRLEFPYSDTGWHDQGGTSVKRISFIANIRQTSLQVGQRVRLVGLFSITDNEGIYGDWREIQPLSVRAITPLRAGR